MLDRELKIDLAIQVRESKAEFVRRISAHRTVFAARPSQGFDTAVRYFVYNNHTRCVEQELSQTDARFNLRDKVSFAETDRTVTGLVAVIVPPKARLGDRIDKMKAAGYSTHLLPPDRNRPQVSYLINVNGVLYWPHVTHLRKTVVERMPALAPVTVSA